MNSIFCSRLRTLREAESRTQADMADLLDVKRATYGGYERGAILPPMDKIEALADHFGVSVDYLCGAVDEKRRSDHQETDVTKRIQDVLDYLRDPKLACLFDGTLLAEMSRELLIEGIENSVKTARRMNKGYQK